MKINLIKQSKSFAGFTKYYNHKSETTGTEMAFSVFLPCEVEKVESCIVWLSGLTCNEDNFITKSGIQEHLSGTTTMIICPDTSPRGLNLPNEHDDYDFGSGAGFYVNATTDGYKNHYKMYDYIKKDIIEIVKTNFNTEKFSISGHSMGGHGALILGICEQDIFCCVSAFSPIVNPIKSPWGQKAFTGYLGGNKNNWKSYDATELILSSNIRNDAIFIDQGRDDTFLQTELLTENFNQACIKMKQKIEIKYRDGYDHSYFYISTFINDHVEFHLENLSM